MPAISPKFCTSCGAPNSAINRVCTRCGTPFPAARPVHAPVPGGRESPVRKPALPPGSPQTLAALLTQFVSGLVKNLPKMAKEMILAAVISLVLVTLLHAALILLYPDGAGGTDFPGAILAVAGLQSSPAALLFWFLFAAIFAFFWSQIRGRGIRPTGQKLASMPGWIAWSLKNAGSGAFPLVMAGVALAAAIRLLLLAPVAAIPLVVLMLGILFSQHESMAVLALRLGYSDLYRAVRKGGPALPSEAFPVAGILGAAAGFLLVVFYADALLALEIAVVLLVIGSILALVLRSRASHRAAAPPVLRRDP